MEERGRDKKEGANREAKELERGVRIRLQSKMVVENIRRSFGREKNKSNVVTPSCGPLLLSYMGLSERIRLSLRIS